MKNNLLITCNWFQVFWPLLNFWKNSFTCRKNRILQAIKLRPSKRVTSSDEPELEFSGSSQAMKFPSRAGALLFSSWNRAEPKFFKLISSPNIWLHPTWILYQLPWKSKYRSRFLVLRPNMARRSTKPVSEHYRYKKTTMPKHLVLLRSSKWLIGRV